MEQASRLPKSFLVVDDDEAFRSRLVRALQARGLRANGAGSVADAMKVAAAEKPQAALIDLRMPGDSGLDLISRLTEKCPGIQMVVLTGYGSIATAVEAPRGAALNYLTQAARHGSRSSRLFEVEAEPSAAAPSTPSLGAR